MKAKAVMDSPFFLSQQHQTQNIKHQTPNSKLHFLLTSREGGRIIYAYLVI